MKLKVFFQSLIFTSLYGVHLLYTNNTRHDQCVSIILPDLNDCKQDGISHFKQHNKCNHANRVCNKTFRISTIQTEPISNRIIPFILSSMLEFCCGKCVRVEYIKNYSDHKNLNVSEVATAHFIFPVLGFKNQEHLYDSYFIPLLEAPQTSFYTKKISGEKILDRLIKSCVGLWPIVIICLLLSIIAGFPVWLMETWDNKDEFPRPFLIGLFEGFWWSFITMTTVGYGDKAPKFLLSRLFTMFWIVIGVTIMATFTAAITTEVLSINAQTSTVKLQGSKIGILRGRLYDASIVLKKGGYVENTKNGSISEGIMELVNRLRNESIDGFLIDKFTYIVANELFTKKHEEESHNKYDGEHLNDNGDNLYNVESIHDGDKEESISEFFLHNMFKEDVIDTKETLSYGVLVKDKDDYNYFKQFAKDNHHMLLTCRELNLHYHHNDKPSVVAYNIFFPKSRAFKTTIMIVSIILAVILFVGVIYEAMRYIMKHKVLNFVQYAIKQKHSIRSDFIQM